MSKDRTSNGHVYEVGQGVTNGLPCDGLVTPATSMAQMQSKTFDVIIIGAGYAGLTAARDLTVAGALISWYLRSSPTDIINQVCTFCYSKHEIVSEAGRGLPKSGIIFTKWGGLGFTGVKLTLGARWFAITCTETSP